MYQEFDLVFTAGKGLLSRAIRWATTDPGEEKSLTNHVGIISKGGDVKEAKIIEALWHVENHSLYGQYHNNGTVAVFRPLNLTEEQKEIIRAYLLKHVGNKYGWWKLGFHAAARFTRWKWIRNLSFLDSRPICSYLVARAFEEAGLSFGMEADGADPDEMMDFCLEHDDKYQIIHLMKRI